MSTETATAWRERSASNMNLTLTAVGILLALLTFFGVLASADSTKASRISVLETEVTGLKESLSNERKARSEAEEKLNSRLDLFGTTQNTILIGISKVEGKVEELNGILREDGRRVK